MISLIFNINICITKQFPNLTLFTTKTIPKFAAVIKQKYRAEGDLGNVAQMARAKQKTLTFAAKPKPLLAAEVLKVFRQIVSITFFKLSLW